MEETVLTKPTLLSSSAPIVLFYVGLLLTPCTAQWRDLPSELNTTQMRGHFCNGFQRSSTTCASANMMCTLCQQISSSNAKRCWPVTGSRMCGALLCRYEDAVVCQHTMEGRICVFRFCSNIVPFCNGSRSPHTQSNPGWAAKRCAPRQTTPDISTIPESSTPPEDTATTEGGRRRRRARNVAPIAIGCVLAILLVLMILVAVVWYLRRRGKLPACMMKTLKPAGLELNQRAPLPDPPALCSEEYAYAYGQRPGEANQADDEYHYYSKLDVDKENSGGGSARYVKDGPGSAKVTSTEAQNDHDYFMLDKSAEPEETIEDGCKAKADSSPGDDEDHTYFPLLKTPEHKSGKDDSGYEVAGKTAQASDDVDASTYDHIERSGGKQSDEGDLADKDDSDYTLLEKGSN